MLNFIKNFRRDEDGAVTVDWVVLTAAVVGLAIAAYTAIETSSLGLITDATETLTVPSDLRSDAPDATLAVTVEPKGGAPGGKATGPVIYSGRLIRE